MILCFVEFFEGGGEFEYWHSKSNTKPKYKLPPDLMRKQKSIWKVHFMTKSSLAHCLKMAPWDPL